MRSLLITVTVGSVALLLSGCPDVPGGSVPSQSDSHWKASRPMRAAQGSAKHAGEDAPARHAGVHHSVSEIAWFQGTIDEAFSRRGCSESPPRRALFHF